MKKLYLFILMVVPLFFASCFEDEGNYSYKDVDEIEIEGMESVYTKNSYNGEVLEIDPVIKTAYTDLEYEWWIWEPNKEDDYTGWNPDKKPYEAELISTDKKLAYEVNCPIGQYKLMLKVKSKSNDFFSTHIVNFNAETLFTRGFYILKETADGKTEVDLYNRNNELMPDLLQMVGHGAMEGKPRAVSCVQSHGMVTEANEYKEIHTVCVTTEANKIAFYDTEAFNRAHDEKDVIDGGLKEGDVPYLAFSYGMSNYFLSSRGCFVTYVFSMMSTSGTFSIPATTGGASQFVIPGGLAIGMSAYFWDETNQRIDYTDFYTFGQMFGPYDDSEFPTQGMKCIACGSSQAMGKGYFILEDAAGKRYIYLTSLGSCKTEARHEIAPESKLAKATHFATNALTANNLYYVYDNKLYAFSLGNWSENEVPLTLEGMGASETITYLSYQWQNYAADAENNFTHLVVGTQQGDTYRLYMYDIEAGEPRELVRKIEGTGKLKQCVYMSPVQYTERNGGNQDISLPL